MSSSSVLLPKNSIFMFLNRLLYSVLLKNVECKVYFFTVNKILISLKISEKKTILSKGKQNEISTRIT